MKTSFFNLLAVSAAFFALCASGMAAGPNSIIRTACLKCHGGASVNGDIDFTGPLTREQRLDALTKAARGEMPMNGPRLTLEQLSQLKKELGFTSAGAPRRPKEASPASDDAKSSAPKRRSLEAGTSEPSQAFTRPAPPKAHAALVKSSDGDAARPKRVTKARAAAADTLASDDYESVLDAVSSAKYDSSKNEDSIKGAKRNRKAVSRQGDSEPWTVVLQMDDNSWDKLTIPGAGDKSSTLARNEESAED